MTYFTSYPFGKADGSHQQSPSEYDASPASQATFVIQLNPRDNIDEVLIKTFAYQSHPDRAC